MILKRFDKQSGPKRWQTPRMNGILIFIYLFWVIRAQWKRNKNSLNIFFCSRNRDICSRKREQRQHAMIVEKWNRNFTVSTKTKPNKIKVKFQWNIYYTTPHHTECILFNRIECDLLKNSTRVSWASEWMNQMNVRAIDRSSEKKVIKLNSFVLYS